MAPENAPKLLSPARLEDIRWSIDYAKKNYHASRQFSDRAVESLVDHIDHRERQYSELVAAIEAHPDVQFVLQKPVGDGIGASRRVMAALAALSPVSPPAGEVS